MDFSFLNSVEELNCSTSVAFTVDSSIKEDVDIV